MKKLSLVLALFIISLTSCDDKRKIINSKTVPYILKSDMLMGEHLEKIFSHPSKKDTFQVMAFGKTMLNATIIFKVVNYRGQEIHCNRFPAKRLLKKEYRTANPALQEAQLREALQAFFETNVYLNYLASTKMAGL